MQKLTEKDLYSLEAYAEVRPVFRAKVLNHKKNRKLAIGPHATLYFEDRLTIQYQIQEMLRVERIFEPEAIRGELDAYNPLIPDGQNLKATFMLEYDDPDERKAALARLKGIEHRVWMAVEGFESLWAITDEDLARENAEKTSAVHFLRFELSSQMAVAAKSDAGLSFGIEHAEYRHKVQSVPASIRRSLAGDLD